MAVDAFGTLIPAIESAMPATEQSVVDAFLTAAKGGDVAALVDLLDPQIVERIAIAGQPVVEIRGAESVAGGPGNSRPITPTHDPHSSMGGPAGSPTVMAPSTASARSPSATAGSSAWTSSDPARLTDFRIAAPS